MNQELTQEQALSVLIQAARLGQKAGAYSIEDAELIAKAIRVFIKPNNEVGISTSSTNSFAASSAEKIMQMPNNSTNGV